MSKETPTDDAECSTEIIEVSDSESNTSYPNPAVAISITEPLIAPGTIEVMKQFAVELYGLQEDEPNAQERLMIKAVGWKPMGRRAAISVRVSLAVFPKGCVNRLAEICQDHGLILLRAVPTIFSSDSDERTAFPYEPILATMIDSAVDVEDVYTFGVRKRGDQPLIACGLHNHELPEGVPRGPSCEHCRDTPSGGEAFRLERVDD